MSPYPMAAVRNKNVVIVLDEETPSGLTATASGANIVLTWSDEVENELGYKIERSLDGSNWSQIAIVGAGTETYTDKNLLPGITYHYRVRAWDADEDGGYSDSDSDTTGAAVVPSSISGNILWLKSNAGLYQDAAGTTPASSDTDPVGKWEDQSGTGNHLTQATDNAKRPTIQTNELDSYPIVRFDGSNDWLRSGSAILGGSWTVFLVVKAPDSAQRNGLFGQYTAGTTNRFYTGLHENSSTGAALANCISTFIHAATNFSNANANLFTSGGYYIIAFRKDATTSYRTYINGKTVAMATSGIPASVQQTNLYLGAIADGVIPGELDIAEIIAYDSALSAANMFSVNNYLQARYPSVYKPINRVALVNNWNLLRSDRWVVKQINAFLEDTDGYLQGATPATTNVFAITRAPGWGTIEVDFVTPASGDFYGGIMFNRYDHNSGWLFRVYQGSAIDWQLFADANGSVTAYNDGGTKTAANSTTYHIKIERSGATVNVYIDDVLYTTASNKLLQYEELVALYYTTDAPGIRFENLTITPAANRPDSPFDVQFPTYEAVADRGIVSDLYVLGSDDPLQNLFVGMGVQGGHGSERQIFYDPNIGQTEQLQNDVVKQIEYFGALAHYVDDSDDGDTNVRFTFYRDRIVAVSTITPSITDNGIGWGHDIDIFEPFMAGEIRHNASGSFASLDVAVDWDALATGKNGPWTVQAYTPWINVRFIAVFSALAEAGTNLHYYEARDTDDGWNFAFAMNRYSLGSGTSYVQRVVLFIDAASAWDDTKAAGVQNDLENPYIGITTGTLVTDDTGDLDTDGYNEITGWYTVQADTNAVVVTFDPSGGGRSSYSYYSPILKITSWTKETDPVISKSTDGGSNWDALVEGTDYVQDVESGCLYVQYIGTISASTMIKVE